MVVEPPANRVELGSALNARDGDGILLHLETDADFPAHSSGAV